MSAELAVSAGELYQQFGTRHIVGAEVLAACHTVLLARSRKAPVLSTTRARYCYGPPLDFPFVEAVHFIPN